MSLLPSPVSFPSHCECQEEGPLPASQHLCVLNKYLLGA